jgi:hypothetical protein
LVGVVFDLEAVHLFDRETGAHLDG